MNHDGHEVVSCFRVFAELKVWSVEAVAAKQTPTSLDNWLICRCSDGSCENAEIRNDAHSKEFRDPRFGADDFGAWNWRECVRSICCAKLLEAVDVHERENGV